MQEQIEIWKDIEGYQGIYQVSNLGRVKSLGNSKSKKEKILKNKIKIQKLKSRDYKLPHIVLHKNGKKKDFIVSRLVYSAFNGKIEDGYDVDHINNNPQDNNLFNLQLLSHLENMRKIYRDNPSLQTGVKPKRIICLNNGIIYTSIMQACRKLNLFQFNIWAVLKGKKKHTHGYRFEYVE